MGPRISSIDRARAGDGDGRDGDGGFVRVTPARSDRSRLSDSATVTVTDGLPAAGPPTMIVRDAWQGRRVPNLGRLSPNQNWRCQPPWARAVSHEHNVNTVRALVNDCDLFLTT
jgi:hypothetical protein